MLHLNSQMVCLVAMNSVDGGIMPGRTPFQTHQFIGGSLRGPLKLLQRDVIESGLPGRSRVTGKSSTCRRYVGTDNTPVILKIP